MRLTFLQLCLVVGLTTCATLPAMAATLFNAQASLSNGGSLSGTVTIDPVTGAVISADLVATLIQTFTFSSNVGGIPNYANSGLFVIVGNGTPGGYPISLLGLPVGDLVNYGGGPASPASAIRLQDGSFFQISAASLALGSINGNIGSFNVSGTAAGRPLGGQISINRSTGEVLSSSMTATIPITYHLNSNVGGVPNYANSGLFVIVVNEAAGAYPIALLGLNVPNLIGFQGGAFSPASDIILANGSLFTVTSGGLIAAPEPSTFGCIALAGLAMLGIRRRLSLRIAAGRTRGSTGSPE